MPVPVRSKCSPVDKLLGKFGPRTVQTKHLPRELISSDEMSIWGLLVIFLIFCKSATVFFEGPGSFAYSRPVELQTWRRRAA
jgi:hypothetical protein